LFPYSRLRRRDVVSVRVHDPLGIALHDGFEHGVNAHSLIRSSSGPQKLKRSAGTWQVCSSVTGSARATAIGAALTICVGLRLEPIDSVVPLRRNPVTVQNLPLRRAVRERSSISRHPDSPCALIRLYRHAGRIEYVGSDRHDERRFANADVLVYPRSED
jgi:hypothetical protein